MEIQALKIFNSIKLTLFLISVLGVITVLTACGDFVKESETGACNSAIDARDYETAISVCNEPEQRKDKASALMGMAGFDIINLLKALEPGKSPTTHTDPTGSNLGTDDIAGASILNILQRGVANYASNDTRAAKISESRTYLDLASDLLQPSLGDNTSNPPPLVTDEILLNTFAISFAMQLNQLEIYDNATTSKETWPVGDNVTDLKCDPVDNVSAASSVLIAMDGHIWAAERNGMSCARILGAINGISDADDRVDAFTKFDAWVDNQTRGKLPEPLDSSVCDPLDNLTTYLSHLALNLTELKKEISVSGDKTIVIEEADNSTKALMAAVGCPKS